MDLIERLRAVAARTNDPLLREAAELARRVDSAPVRNVVGQQWDDVFAREGNVVWCSDLHPGQRVRIVPEQGEGDRG